MRRTAGRLCRPGVGLIIASLLPLGPAVATVPSAIEARVLDTDFDRVTHVKAIPGPVLAALAPLVGGRPLADPVYLDQTTHTWKPNGGDRLLFAAGSPTLWLVHYEQPAATPARYVAIIEITGPGQAMVAEHLLMNAKTFSVPALKNMIRMREFTVLTGTEATKKSR